VREPIREKKALFDMAVAGPIAGFLVALPIAAWGIWHTRVNFDPPAEGTIYFGYPLAVKLLQLLLTGHTFSSVHVVEHPAFLAAWWGFVVTAINLIPAGQLDGGHTLYAVLGRRHRLLRWPVLLVLAGLGFLYPGWWLWAVIVLVLTGLQHPPVLDEDVPSTRAGGRSRRASPCSSSSASSRFRSGSQTTSRRFVRQWNVAGPSFTSSTSIAAPKLPVATGTPEARSAAR
jgi:Predicted membrane-associated Zn-dependent proteases 1